MIRIPIETAAPYEVLLEEGLLTQTVFFPEMPAARRVVVVSDERVHALYGESFLASLRSTGFESHAFVFPPGEASKNFRNYEALLRFLAAANLERKDFVIALGGGVTGDLAGFAAATYLRGIPWVQIPTTLLAMIDSSVGGKTGLNLPEGKNLIGAFHQPSLVLCDPSLLASLPAEELQSGWGELIKTGLLDRTLWEMLEQQRTPLPGAELIARAIKVKAALVAADETDFGPRRLLNLGHSFGHAIEAAGGYRIPHGQAVAMGLKIVTRCAIRQGLCEASLLPRLEALLEEHHLNKENPYGAELLLPFMKRDKKAGSGRLNLVVPREAGRCEIMPVEWAELPNWIE